MVKGSSGNNLLRLDLNFVNPNRYQESEYNTNEEHIQVTRSSNTTKSGKETLTMINAGGVSSAAPELHRDKLQCHDMRVRTEDHTVDGTNQTHNNEPRNLRARGAITKLPPFFFSKKKSHIIFLM